MYAATKMTDEALADVYCRLNTEMHYPPIGLRFFTVYGPWGRPDMAVYAFADSMTHNKEIVLFTAKYVFLSFYCVFDFVVCVYDVAVYIHVYGNTP